MTKKYFGTDGIRGAINSENINGDMFFKFGLASGTYFKSQKKRKQTAIIAKDTRLSGYTLEPALVSGLASAGMHVYTLGPLPTNGLAMLTKALRANMGIMITASHNPHNDNGLKLFGPDGMKLSDKIEKKIESLIDKKIIKNLSKPEKLGRVKRLETGTNDYIKILKKYKVPFVIQHSQGTPENMQKNPRYKNELLDIYDFFEKKIKLLRLKGIKHNKIILDPGIGFGKNLKHNMSLIRNISMFHSLGFPILVGNSRKRFIKELSGKNDSKFRNGGTIASSIYLMMQGVQILRIHDVNETIQGLKIFKNIINN